MVCGVDQWDAAATTKLCDSHTDQSDSAESSFHHSLYADYINRLFSTARESARVRGLLTAMFKGDSILLLNTLDVLLWMDQRNSQQKTPPTADTPRYMYNVHVHVCCCTSISYLHIHVHVHVHVYAYGDPLPNCQKFKPANIFAMMIPTNIFPAIQYMHLYILRL